MARPSVPPAAPPGVPPGVPPAVPPVALAASAVDAGVVVLRSGDHVVVALEPSEVLEASGRSALDVLDALGDGWWAGYLAYDLGRAVERVVARRPFEPSTTALPDLLLARFDARLVIDAAGARLEGAPAACRRLAARLDRADRPGPPPRLGPGRSSLGRDRYEAAVRDVRALLEAGECYQVNLTRRLAWDRRVDPGPLFAALDAASPAPHAALVALPARSGPVGVASASPERFLAWEDRRVETRPVKGTARDAATLLASAKDHAENVMIVDLARNDLGRVCEPGSVQVSQLCGLEAHPGLHHLVSTVHGVLRPDVGPGALLRATFPPASVTGAPKPRVLQAIEDLEPVRRGVYCGAIGWIDGRRGAGDLSVAIRAFTVDGDGTHLGVGAGIVADSDPVAEWRETELKAARLLHAAGASTQLHAARRTHRAGVGAGGRRAP